MDKSFFHTLTHRSPLTVCVASEVISMHLCINFQAVAQVHHISWRYLSGTNHLTVGSPRVVPSIGGWLSRSIDVQSTSNTLSGRSDRFGRESGPRPNSREYTRLPYRARISCCREHGECVERVSDARFTDKFGVRIVRAGIKFSSKL